MENTRKNRELSDESMLVGAEGEAATAASKAATADALDHGAMDEPSLASPPAKRKLLRFESLSREQRQEMHVSFNDRISYLCKLAALIIAVVALGTTALGREMPEFVLMGLCLSVALLALAMLQDHNRRRR